jgi:hypothetical protein
MSARNDAHRSTGDFHGLKLQFYLQKIRATSIKRLFLLHDFSAAR